jgi:hypothetical protein
MENKQQIVNVLSGINELQPQLPDHLTELVNWTTDNITGGWSSKIGYEMYFAYRNDWVPFQQLAVVDSLYCSIKHQGAQTLYLFEAGGILYSLDEFTATPTKLTLVSDRTINKRTEARTQYMQVGKFILIANGYDKPLKLIGWPQVQTYFMTDRPVYPIGFWRVPGTPYAWQVETSLSAVAAAGDITSVAGFSTDYARTGLGIKQSTKENIYKWRVSFVTLSGSESPISSESIPIEWTTPSSNYGFNVTVELPIGDNDVVARRLYRTKNYSDDAGNSGSIFYFVTDIPNNHETFFIDDYEDTALGSQMPDESTSILFPAPQFRFMGLYKDCLFVDGGISNDDAIYFSYPTRPDQFEALNFITVGRRQNGGITGFHGYFGYLLVFRENGIDVIQGDYPNFTATPFESHIGTKAVDTITSIPDIGVVFLTIDGVYAVQKNIEYSDTTAVMKISHAITDTISRLNVAMIASATAVYSAKHREWHCYFAVDGSDVPNMGIIYHLDKNAWSIRENFPVNCITKNMDGELIFGLNSSAPTNADPAGLFVISKRRALGQKISGDNIVDDDPPTSIMASAWLDMGDPSLKKKVHGVYLFIRTGGSTTIAMNYYKDFDYNTTNTTSAIKLQRADFTDQNVYDVVLLDKDKYWEEPMVTPIRFDVHNGSCSWFRWKIETTVDVIVVGYAIDFTVSGTRIIAGKRLS